MPPPYDWQAAYAEAILETEWPTASMKKIELAEALLHQRQSALLLDNGETAEERAAITQALSGLVALRADVADWHARRQERINALGNASAKKILPS